MAPEQARGAADARSDVYALGALLVWYLAPERGGPVRMPRPLKSIAAKARAADPAARYATAEAFAADLSRYLDAQAVSAHRESLAERTLRFARTYRVAILLVARLPGDADRAAGVSGTVDGLIALIGLIEFSRLVTGWSNPRTTCSTQPTCPTEPTLVYNPRAVYSRASRSRNTHPQEGSVGKPILGLILGGILGALDGWSALLSAPEVAPDIVGIVIGSTMKGLLGGVITGYYARRVRSLRAGLIFGGAVGLFLAFLVAVFPSPTARTTGGRSCCRARSSA